MAKDKNKSFLLIVLSAIAIIFLSFSVNGTRPSPQAQKNEVTQSEHISLVATQDDQTAYSLLEDYSKESETNLETQQYDFGIFVKKIGELESSAEKAWIYFINGESGQVAADQAKLKAGDIVEWKYVTPSN